MARKQEPFIEVLLKAPWWMSVILGVISYVGLRWVVPGMFAQNNLLKGFAIGISGVANMALLLFGVTAVLSAIFGLKRRGLVDQQKNLESLRSTSWKDFEYLVAEAYRRLGFAVDYSLGSGADGGVDLVLRKDGKTSLVQCKQWKKSSVGAPIVREMYGLMTAERADEVIIVTSGHFTHDAQSFADGKPIRMVDGTMLLELVRSVQGNVPVKGDPMHERVSEPITADVLSAERQCPKCGGEMVERTARRGGNSGQKFLGCRKYPACKGTRGY